VPNWITSKNELFKKKVMWTLVKKSGSKNMKKSETIFKFKKNSHPKIFKVTKYIITYDA
jgi:hypothetical protein